MTGIAPPQAAPVLGSLVPWHRRLRHRELASVVGCSQQSVQQAQGRCRGGETASAASAGTSRYCCRLRADPGKVAGGLNIRPAARRRMAGQLQRIARVAANSGDGQPIRSLQTLTSWVAATASGIDGHDPADMVLLFSALQAAAKQVAFAVSQAAIQQVGGAFAVADAPDVSSGRDAPKQLDIIANEILKAAMASTGLVAIIASEEDDEPVHLNDNGKYVVVFDPLDGSRNIECSIPTGTIFGVYALPEGYQPGQSMLDAVLRQGSEQLASGYALYSSATMFVATLGGGSAAGFTLDTTIGEFVATHPDLRIPPRGQIYSLNDARYPDWPDGLKRYIDDVRAGRGQSGKQYSARYVCSLVADVHRTLIYGGFAANPRSHLRLVYEGAPLAFLLENAGGKGTDGKRDLLTMKPGTTHERLPVFLGSTDDIDELLSYDDVQQTSKKTYNV